MDSEDIRCEDSDLILLDLYRKNIAQTFQMNHTSLLMKLWAGGYQVPAKDKRSGHPEFYVLLDEMGELHHRKNQDYGDGDPFGNFKNTVSVGVDPFRGVLVRLTDKWSRIQSLSKAPNFEGRVEDESLEDTLMDNAVYSLIAIVLLREKREENEEEEDMAETPLPGIVFNKTYPKV